LISLKNVTKKRQNNWYRLLSLSKVCFSWLYFKVPSVLRGDFYLGLATDCTDFTENTNGNLCVCLIGKTIIKKLLATQGVWKNKKEICAICVICGQPLFLPAN
jgi:hypothetical protein